jgi:hypothetical protein
MKYPIFWDVEPFRSCVNRRFGGKCRLHFQGRKIRERGTSVSRWLQPQAEDYRHVFVSTDISIHIVKKVRNFWSSRQTTTNSYFLLMKNQLHGGGWLFTMCWTYMQLYGINIVSLYKKICSLIRIWTSSLQFVFVFDSLLLPFLLSTSFNVCVEAIPCRIVG